MTLKETVPRLKRRKRESCRIKERSETEKVDAVKWIHFQPLSTEFRQLTSTHFHSLIANHSEKIASSPFRCNYSNDFERSRNYRQGSEFSWKWILWGDFRLHSSITALFCDTCKIRTHSACVMGPRAQPLHHATTRCNYTFGKLQHAPFNRMQLKGSETAQKSINRHPIRVGWHKAGCIRDGTSVKRRASTRCNRCR